MSSALIEPGTEGVFVIAEAGVNHNGDPALARRLIDVAADAGADAVKFQTFTADSLATDAAPVADYQRGAVADGQSQHDMLRALELAPAAHADLKAHAEHRGVEFISTPFDCESLRFLVDDLGVATLKIGSGNATDGPLLLEAARSGCRLIVSTGMCDLEEVAAAIDLIAFGMTSDRAPSGSADFAGARTHTDAARPLAEKLTLLHCTSLYPAPAETANLRAMETMRRTFGLPVGYSDHVLGGTVALAAVAAGAAVIEKHVTLDCAMPGPDHAASMEPAAFASLVADIRTVDAALGTASKEPVAAEHDMRRIARKSLVAAQAVAAGSVLTTADVSAKRPGDGISPMAFWDVIDTPAKQDYEADERVSR
jgi:N-acetylneuraminate synthase